MKDVTLIIQGKVSQETLDFYIENYPSLNVIISTWVDNNLDLSNLPITYRLVTQQLPDTSGFQNQNYQFVSTINGLHLCNTPYVIKMRGDEYYNNIEYIYSRIQSIPEKIHCSPVFFRHWSYMKFHISDHIIAGTKEKLLTMFESTKTKVDNGEIFHIVDGKIHMFWEPEINLTRGYLMKVEPSKFGFIDGRKLMIKHFDILDIELLEPYKIVANIFNKTWTSGFIPEMNYSISDVRKLLLENENNIYDTNIT
jgi:hypothetical protein